MPVIQRTTDLAIAETNPNVLSGSQFEFARQNQILSAGIVSDVADVFATFNSGADIVLEESELEIKSSYPTIPDEMYYTDVAAQADRLSVRARNANAGAAVVRTLVQITPIA